MTRLYTNNFSTTLDGAITAVATSIDVASATGLPSVGGGDTCQLTLDDGGGNIEIVTCTAVSSNTLTVTRAQEGTSGFAFGDGDTVELRPTALSFIDPAGDVELSGEVTLSGTVAGAIDAGGATSLEIPNSGTPTVDADGEIAVDTSVTDFSHGVMKYYGGEEMGVVAMPIAEFSSPTDTHVVTYNATNDEFELAAAGGGGGSGAWTLITSTTASSDATVDFTGLTSSYIMYKLIITHCTPVSDAVPWLRFSSNGGSSYDNSSNNYEYAYQGYDVDGTDVVGNSASSTQIVLGPSVENDSGSQFCCEITLYNPSADERHVTRYTTTGRQGADDDSYTLHGVGFRDGVQDTDAIRFMFSTGNVSNGEFRLYGLTAS